MPAPPAEVAQAEVLARLLAAQFFATTAQLAAGTGLGKGCVARTIAAMERQGRIEAATLDGGGEQGWRLSGDSLPDVGDAAGIIRVLHVRDPLVRPRLDELAQQFAGREVLQYLLIDDDIHGAACGHWRIKAQDVEDVLIDDACVGWRDEVLEAVRRR